MLRRLFRSRSNLQPSTARAPFGLRIYTIGDVHGRLDLLIELLRRIEDDGRARAEADTLYIFLGDLIDRGSESAGVVEMLRALSRGSSNYRFILGNHEEVFLNALNGDLRALALFNRIGGRETILSYGVSEADYTNCDYPGLLEIIRQAVPREHVNFLASFEDKIVLGDYAFVHAGVRPGVGIADQRPSDLRWIRQEFLSHTDAFEKLIVHGHTISEDVLLSPNRIGLDTGAYASGKLTAMGFEENKRWVMQTG